MFNQKRVIIENVTPQVDNGTFPIKRITGQKIQITADVLADGHDVLEAAVHFKHEKEKKWTEVRLNSVPNDCFVGEFTVESKDFTVILLKLG